MSRFEALPVPTHVHKLMLGLMLSLAIGFHWSALQSAAWVNMLITYSQQDGFQQAIIKTFNGLNPCEMCKLVADGRKAEEESSERASVKKLELIAFADTATTFFLNLGSSAETPFTRRAIERVYPPVAPPPELV